MKHLTLILARLLLLLLLTGLLVVPIAVGVASLPAIAYQVAAVLALFGLWSAACVLLGAWLTWRKQTSSSPMPPVSPDEAFNWIRHGKTTPKEGDDPAPEEFATEAVDHVPFKL